MNPLFTYTKLLKSVIILLGLLLLGDGPAIAQNGGGIDHEPGNERGSFDARRKMILDGNNLRATYHNFGWGGRLDGQAVDEVTFEFPRNTNRVYIALVAFFVGAEVGNQSDTGPERFPIVLTPNGRTAPDGSSWDMNPVPGYYNPDVPELYARSDRPETWPSFWPDKMDDQADPGWSGSWNGFFGKDQFNADQEFYYRASGNLYTRFSEPTNPENLFRPDATDPVRGGLGLIIDARIMAWSQALINDTHFNIFEIRNDGSFDYDKMAFTLWIADLVGGGGNDLPEFDERSAISYLTKLPDFRSGIPVFDGGLVGMAGIQFLETPGNSIDGIDNDGDSDLYMSASDWYNSENPDLLQPLVEANGGFFQNTAVLMMEVIPEFEVNDFGTRTICPADGATPGDRIVLIDENHDRVIMEYPENGGTFVSQGREFTLSGRCYDLTEDVDLGPNDLFPDASNTDLFDNNLNGLIDENEELHRTKQFFDRVQRRFIERPVRYINYMWDQYEVGDTLQRGLIVPNQMIRERMAEDESFRNLVQDYQEALRRVHVDGGYRSPDAFDNYFRNYHTSAPMIDESREDYFDNNMAWNAMIDDVGLDGVPFSGARGEGTGFPTSGAGTPFPGEPNIDKTSVAESDMIGISSVTFPLAGSLGDGVSFARDGAFWRNRMLPGNLGEEAQAGDDTDILVTSSLFPLQRGQTERFSVAITIAQTNSQIYEDDRDRVNDNLDEAFNAYEADYQFATAPPVPNVTAIAGDGKVTLYWDEIAEDHFDRYLSRLPGNTDADARNFQGYKVYRSTDSGFQDILDITDARGNKIFRRPLAVFDVINEWMGLHPVDINGVKFNLGSNSGIQRKFVDENVVNGRRYYYAVTSYTFGNVRHDIAPSESPIYISINPDGSVTTGPNVEVVTPAASKAGYIDPENPLATPVRGTTSGQVFVEVLDPEEIRIDNLYRVTFRDTLIPSGRDDTPDTLRTKDFSLFNLTSGDTLIENSTNFNMEDNPVKEGFRLTLDNSELELSVNRDRSGWAPNPEYEVDIHNYRFFLEGTPRAADYMVVFGEVGLSRSIDTTYTGLQLPAKDVNYKVYNTTITDEDGNPIEVETAFFDRHINPDSTLNDPNISLEGEFSAGLIRPDPRIPQVQDLRDQIFLFEPIGDRERVLTWFLFMSPNTTGRGGNMQVLSRNPLLGDTLHILTRKPFTSLDVFEFRMSDMQKGMVDLDKAREELKQIRVVPNPYVATNPFEPAPTMARPDQVRELHFTRIPVPSTIRIFTVDGQLVQTINATEANTFNGTYKWDMLTKDNLELSYGVYIYHVKAPDVGEHVSRFAVIK